MTVTSTRHTRPSLPLRGRAFRALVLAPERPLDAWFAQLDALVLRSPTLFAERAVILDAAGLAPEAEESAPDLAHLLAELGRRGIRILGIERAEATWTDAAMPPRLAGGRPAPITPPIADKPKLNSCVLETSLRSGQSIFHPDGDVTVMGSVSSGAEILAGGSIHVYGALRGRAIAGAGGNRRARIYCRKFQPELLGIDGLFRTAETTDPGLHNKAVQVWLERDALRMAALD
ncbi:septum site-determining protein MinC [Methylobacterium sp. 4-46]|uniref:septum site-determining protein MinC n=1 Tax=unclassified Methylobacterium TaxID=2615210 RepID=UPI000165CA88|nr:MULTISPECIES: septum site-determining protein MinC [Methylobacterium]ACA14856.1 septum site-determining protein MinC [Methylobacterium sp. 4-46]WFT80598.1 septum site-determining protein MinC [Methylobacterium nodulans]